MHQSIFVSICMLLLQPQIRHYVYAATAQNYAVPAVQHGCGAVGAAAGIYGGDGVAAVAATGDPHIKQL